MKKSRRVAGTGLLAGLLLAGSIVSGPATSISFAQRPVNGLKSLAPSGFRIGAKVDVDADFPSQSPFTSEPEYRDTFGREFNLVSTAAFKMKVVRPSRDTWDFRDINTVLDYAEANNKKVHAHVLVYGLATPDWVTLGNFSAMELEQIMVSHIRTIIRHCEQRARGVVAGWEVVNEAVNQQGQLKDEGQTPWAKVPNYIEKAFRAARQELNAHGSSALLYYNDNNNEAQGDPKAEAIYNLIAEPLSRKYEGDRRLLDGIGWQLHVGYTWRITPPCWGNANRIKVLGKTRGETEGLKVAITEMDVNLYGPGTWQDRLDQQKSAFRSALNFCLVQPNCDTFIMWGFTDKYKWDGPKNLPSPSLNPLIFDDNYYPKPAYFGLVEAFNAH